MNPTFISVLISHYALRAFFLLGLAVTLSACIGDDSSNDDNTASYYDVNVTVTGLVGSGLILQNNKQDDLYIDGDGSYAFNEPMVNWSDYSVKVKSEPMEPAQNCNVSNGEGVIAGRDVTDIMVTCLTQHQVRGTVSGLSEGSVIVIRNNGHDELTLETNGGYTFTDPVSDTAEYSVEIVSQPDGHICGVANGFGAIAAADVTNVNISCVKGNTVTVASEIASGYHSWRDDHVSTHCLAKGDVYESGGWGLLAAGQYISEYELERELGLDRALNVQYGYFFETPAYRYFDAIAEDELSVSYTFPLLRGILKYSRFIADSINPLSLAGEEALNSGAFYDLCGDEFIPVIGEGGGLYITLKYRFASESDKQAFISSMSFELSDLGEGVDYGSLTNDIRENTRLYVVIFQQGGDAIQFPLYSDGSSSYVYISTPCNLNDSGSCDALIDSTVDYAVSEFPGEVAANPAILYFETQQYSFAGVGVAPLEAVPAQLIDARNWLADKRAKWLAIRKTAMHLLEAYAQELDENRKSALRSLVNQANDNLFHILVSANTCYNEISHLDISPCLTSLAEIQASFSQAEPFEQTILEIPTTVQ